MGALSKIGLIILIIALVVIYLIYYYILFPRMILLKLKRKLKAGTMQLVDKSDYTFFLPLLKVMKISELKPDDYGIIQILESNSFLMADINLGVKNIMKDKDLSLVHDSTSLFIFLSKSFSDQSDADYLFRSKDLIIIKRVPDSNFYIYLKYLPPFARK